MFFLIGIALCLYHRGNAQECNYRRPCATGNISREICHQRQCCYSQRNDSLSTCFQKSVLPYHTVQTSQDPEVKKFGEVVPDDGVKLPNSLQNTLKNLGNLTKVDALRAINKLETYLQNTARNNTDLNWDYGLKKTFMALVKVNMDSILQPIVFASGTEIQLQQHWGTMKNGTARNISNAIFVEYPSLISVFMKANDQRRKECQSKEKYLDGSPVVSVRTYDEHWNKLSVPVTYSVKGLNISEPTNNEDIEADLSCTYLNEIMQKWSTHGCEVSSLKSSKMTCSCNHTTKFSMLFVLKELELNISKHQTENINKLEYVMESLSVTCLVATFGVLWVVQRRRSKALSISSTRAGERTAVHANFVSALAFLHFVRLFSELATQNDEACKTVAVLSHYFMLSSGMWMFIEGLLLYLNVIIRSMRNTALGVHKYWAGWGIPAIIVVISAAIGLTSDSYVSKAPVECPIEEGVEKIPIFPQYKKYQSFCWLGKQGHMIWAAAGPLMVIFAVNCIILAHTVIFVWRLNRKTDKMMPSDYSNDSKHFWKTAKSVLVLFPILGVPWLIGFFINMEETTLNIIFQYIHVILNGLQGFFIFLLYCVVNRESRGIVSRVASSRWEQHKVSISASNTLARSTSGGSRKERAHRGQRKSISSQMGASEQNAVGTPANVRSLGSAASQYSIYTSSMNRKQSSGSGSTTASGCAHRINRIISVGSTDVIRHKPGYYMKAGSSASLPRLSKSEHHKHFVRSGSVSSIHMTGRYNRHTSEALETFICKACREMPCVHAAGDVAGLQEIHNGGPEATLLGYKRTSSLDSLQVSDVYLQNRWPRMTAEEFKRFSAIPEEKRRSGINSYISGDSSEHLSNRMSVLSSFKNEEIEMKELQKNITKADVVAEDMSSELEEQKELEKYIETGLVSAKYDRRSDEEANVIQIVGPEITITVTDDSGNLKVEDNEHEQFINTLADHSFKAKSEVYAFDSSELLKNATDTGMQQKNMKTTEKYIEKRIDAEHSIADESGADAIERLRQEELKLTD